MRENSGTRTTTMAHTAQNTNSQNHTDQNTPCQKSTCQNHTLQNSTCQNITCNNPICKKEISALQREIELKNEQFDQLKYLIEKLRQENLTKTKIITDLKEDNHMIKTELEAERKKGSNKTETSVSQQGNNEQEQTTVRVEIQAMKHIIGRKGANIEKIRRETQTEIRTGERAETGKQKITISGKAENIAKATEKIEESAKKLKICEEYINGKCRKHNTCKYAHVKPPLLE